MNDAAAWKTLFDTWPAGIGRSGVIVTTLNEQIPFDGFMHSETFLMVERKTPDTLGARKIVIPLSGIALIKFTEVLSAQPFNGWGFAGKVGAKKAAAH
jgi:hypothetical protein